MNRIVGWIVTSVMENIFTQKTKDIIGWTFNHLKIKNKTRALKGEIEKEERKSIIKLFIEAAKAKDEIKFKQLCDIHQFDINPSGNEEEDSLVYCLTMKRDLKTFAILIEKQSLVKELIKTLEAKDEIKFKQLLDIHQFDINSSIDNENKDRLAHLFARKGDFKALEILIKNKASFFYVRRSTLRNPPLMEVNLTARDKINLTFIYMRFMGNQDRILEDILSRNSLEDLLRVYSYQVNYKSRSLEEIFSLEKFIELAKINNDLGINLFLTDLLFSYDSFSTLRLLFIKNEVNLFRQLLSLGDIYHNNEFSLEVIFFCLIKYALPEYLLSFLSFIKDSKIALPIVNNRFDESIAHQLAHIYCEETEIPLFRTIYKFLSSEINININSKNNNGRTPLYLATIFKNELLVKILLEIGVDITLRDKDNWTAENFLNLSHPLQEQISNEEGISMPLHGAIQKNNTLLYNQSSSSQEEIITRRTAEVVEIEKKKINVFPRIQDIFSAFKIDRIHKKINQLLLPFRLVSKERGWAISSDLPNIPADLQHDILKLIAAPSNGHYDKIISRSDCDFYFNKAWHKSVKDLPLY